MPRITSDPEVQTPHGYGFSAVGAEDLEASEYTLVSIVQDSSSSVHEYQSEIVQCLKTILEACQASPRSENLMLRTTLFDSDVSEFFGFRMLNDIESDEFDNVFRGTGGMTALFDSAHTAIDSTLTYGKQLTNQGIACNAIIFVITDGKDNASKYQAADVKKLIAQARKDENVESALVIVVGITDGQEDINSYLEDFKTDADLDQYINIGQATNQALAKLADFVSRSISSQSQSLGSGGSSSLLSF